MHDTAFDEVSRAIGEMRDRRAALQVLGGGLVGAMLLAAEDAVARRRKKPHNHNAPERKERARGHEHGASAEGKKKKATYCLNGQTVSASKKRRKKLVSSGATPGPCATPGTTTPAPRTCSSNDQCGAESICALGVCHTCTVTCTGGPEECGAALQEAIDQGGTIFVCPGTYIGRFTAGAVTLIGAGSDNDRTNNTILTAARLGRTLSFDEGVTASLAQMRISGAQLTGNGNGGGIYASKGDLTITDCAISDNQAANGGGVYVNGGRLQMRGATVTFNEAGYGGGVHVTNNAIATLSNTLIEDNTAKGTASVRYTGGGIYLGFSQLTTTRCDIHRNKAANKGGGVMVDGFSARLNLDSGTRITDNQLTDTLSGDGGGGVYSPAAGFSQNGATVQDNTPDNIKTI